MSDSFFPYFVFSFLNPKFLSLLVPHHRTAPPHCTSHLIFLSIYRYHSGGAITVSADSGWAPGTVGGGITVVVGLHLAEVRDRVFDRGRDEEETASEVKMDEGGRSRQREVSAYQEEAPRIEVSHCLRGGSMP